MTENVRVRGIYATALTRRFREAGLAVVDASDAIRRRFDDLSEGASDAAVRTTDDRQGVGVVGNPEAVERVGAVLAAVGRDALSWESPTPPGSVHDAVVAETLGSGAVLELDEGEAFLPYDDADGYVETGDHLRVQIREDRPPWGNGRPEAATGVEVGGELVALRRGHEGVRANARDAAATELVRSTELLSAETPEGWGIRWEASAVDADVATREAALSAAADRAEEVDAALAETSPAGEGPGRLATPRAAAWVWFGRESRFELDESRREVTATMPGHHRIKAATGRASDAVDFVEAVCADPGAELPFGAVTGQFGPREGDRVAIEHGKPDGRVLTLGRGEVTDRDRDGSVTIRRELSSSGTYDALGTRREPGDAAITNVKEGRWWYPTAYRGEDGGRKGTYVNICTPVEVFPREIRYVDLHVDVVRRPGGEVERVDDEELDAAVAAGEVPESLAEKAREVAGRVQRVLKGK